MESTLQALPCLARSLIYVARMSLDHAAELLLIEISRQQREAVRNIVARRAADQDGSLFIGLDYDHENVNGQFEARGVTNASV